MLYIIDMEESNELISVIVPVYNVEQYLDKCVQSIIDQTYGNLEIILIDDGSTDHSGEICENWRKKDKRIIVVHKKNGGLSEARNAGLDISTGKYIAFVDSDDWIRPRMMETLQHVMVKEAADICSCGILSCFPDRVEQKRAKPLKGASEDILKYIYCNTEYAVAAWNKLYRRELWLNIRFPVGKICEDAFTAFLLVEKAKKVVQIQEAFYCYRIRENSIMTTEFRMARMDEEEAWRVNYEYMEKYHPQIAKDAFNFYLQKVNILIHTIGKAQRDTYISQYRYLYNILKHNFVYILINSGLSLKYRVHFIFDFIKLPMKKEMR